MTVTFIHDAIARRIQQQRGYVAALEQLCAGLDDGTAEWWDYDDTMTGLDKPNRAAEGAAQALEDARKELEALGGTQ